MRFVLKLVTILTICSMAGLTACGPKETNPKAIEVKEDPRIQRSSVGGEDKKSENQKALPP
jgi:hypothetical protein